MCLDVVFEADYSAMVEIALEEVNETAMCN